MQGLAPSGCLDYACKSGRSVDRGQQLGGRQHQGVQHDAASICMERSRGFTVLVAAQRPGNQGRLQTWEP